MKKKLMIRLMGHLEEVYPSHYRADKLKDKLKLQNLGGELSKIIRYLKATNKIIVHLPETRIAPTQRDQLVDLDEITITPEGIDFLIEIKKLETDKNRNYLLLDTTIVLTQIAIIGIILTLYNNFKPNLSNLSINVPSLLSAIMGVVFISFSILLLFKILNVIFSKESWRGIFFDRE